MLDEQIVGEQTNGRTEPRMNLFLSASAEIDGRCFPVRIRNLSALGAMIESPDLPGPGNAVLVERTGLKVAGILQWSRGQRAGVRFDRSIDLAAWSPPRIVSRRNQADVDREIATARAGQSQPLSPPRLTVPHDPELRRRIGDELRAVSIMLENAGGALAGDPAVIDRHLERLQEFDIASQMLAELASLLSSDNPAAAVGDVNLSDLKGRLTRPVTSRP